MAAYQALLGEQPKPSTKIAGSLGLLITEYYGSRDFRSLKASSQKIYRYVLEPIAKAHGHRNAMITHKQAARLVGDIGDRKPGMANLTKSVLQKLFKYAVRADWRGDNPIIGIDRFKTGTHHTWTEGELQTFEKHWPIGTRQRLAYELLLETAQRVGDVARMRRSGYRRRGTARHPGKDRRRTASADHRQARSRHEGIPLKRPRPDRRPERPPHDASGTVGDDAGGDREPACRPSASATACVRPRCRRLAEAGSTWPSRSPPGRATRRCGRSNATPRRPISAAWRRTRGGRKSEQPIG